MPGFTVVAVPHRFQAGQSSTSGVVSGVDVHGHGTTTGTAHHDIGPVLVKFGLGDGDGGGEIIIRQGRVQDGVAVVVQVGRF